ncbi:retroviral-like aspartic protease family protein [Vitreimonas flagellata]|uniref:retroviral-like aspartic protease family protein n=1 Tax=Vitreimonas flagellata TaxID=2560861 RepID=UPI001074F6EE|nr:retroviral-like aspartic protease family protein [Vitreimonas flagellata]
MLAAMQVLRLLLLGLAAVLWAGTASARCLEAPDLAAYQTATPEDFAMGATRSDRVGRVVAQVSVNGQGPFRFIVDTGANRSVLSQALVDRLGLTPTGTGEVHSVHGVTVAPLVQVNSLHYGDLALGVASMPALQGGVLAGEQGLLGVDGMRGRRLRMDFERNCIEISSARGSSRLRGWSRVRGELRFGHLIVVRGAINGVRTNLLIDTGSDTSLANNALRTALDLRLQRSRELGQARAYTAGEPIMLTDSVFMPRMRFGGLVVRNVRAYVGDFHIFRIWGMTEEPTLLVGMDVLSQSRGMAIDYARGIVYFDIQDGPPTGSRLDN